MKSLLKAPVAYLLALLARAIIRKYRPVIVMVTGSVGKTSTKDAVKAALSEGFYLRASEKSYNSEFGVPLTIIGAKNPWENATAWYGVFQEALALIMLPSHYPKLLVLEVGADRPGDLSKILKIATPDAVVVTRLPDVPVHVEAYATPQAVRDEEFTPASALASHGTLIICADDPYAVTMSQRLHATITTFGFAEGATVRIEDPSFYKDADSMGMEATIDAHGRSLRIRVEGALGKTQLLAPAAAFALAIALGLTEEEALTGLATYSAPPGRARVLNGLNGSLIIDDTYNASPVAVEEALLSLGLVPNASRRIAVLGDMLELGRYSKAEHERVGTLAAERADLIVTVGSRAKAICEAARATGRSDEDCISFDTSTEAAEALAARVQEGDVVLVKGSQGVRMERVVEALLADPSDSAQLVRQEKEWKRR
ncbi:MAG: UDP-N-acetylmuramoyl-tripeptide--D-alanyl-D-alanine ligase [Parcubacteria bacterium C7867-004]|nr:MAG: UDP-N-acetylmuramoyl-tripeptide--D-alanyl-D-alanine ligase [Parcubacteria bacterium C7867-004]